MLHTHTQSTKALTLIVVAKTGCLAAETLSKQATGCRAYLGPELHVANKSYIIFWHDLLQTN